MAWRVLKHIAPAAIVLLADRLFKALVAAFAVRWAPADIFRFELFENRGIAFSLGFAGPAVWVLSLAILSGVIFLGYREVRRGEFARLAGYALFCLGAFSNLFDRIAYGHVVDYLIFFDLSAVNLADAMIIAGAFLMLRKRTAAPPLA
jgi:lipoprotein signal peptidase